MIVSGGNPSYTIKEGGTLRKKVYPMAADKVKRNQIYVPQQQLKSLTAPGTYNLPGGFGPKNQLKNANGDKTGLLKDMELKGKDTKGLLQKIGLFNKMDLNLEQIGYEAGIDLEYMGEESS